MSSDWGFQIDLTNRVKARWQEGQRNVLMRSDTGTGKTRMLSGIVRDEGNNATATFAHRQELVGQLSKALASQGVLHRVVAPTTIVSAIAASHVAVFGRSFVNANAAAGVAGVDTLVRRPVTDWDRAVRLWTADEAHHVLDSNKWGAAIKRFTHPLVRGLGPTATPQRADGRGLGRHVGGLFDVMEEGPPMRWAIENGYLSKYRVVCPASDLANIDIGDVSASGDWSPKKLRQASQRSRIVGSAVEEYLARARGLLGITFTTDVETATEMAEEFRLRGVPAATITGDMHDGARRQIIQDFEARKILMLVAVDVISEGFDVPSVEVGIFARPTMSLALYMQQFGRVLRVMPGKDYALIIDLAGNVLTHLPPDRPRKWSLDGVGGRGSNSGLTVRMFTCSNVACMQPYERFHTACPFCHTGIPEPAGRRAPDQVSGDLIELDEDILAMLRGNFDNINLDREAFAAHLVARRVPSIGQPRLLRKHAEDQESQKVLRGAMGLWGGARKADGLNDREIQRKFFLRFGVDVLTAQALKSSDAEVLTLKVYEEFANAAY